MFAVYQKFRRVSKMKVGRCEDRVIPSSSGGKYKQLNGIHQFKISNSFLIDFFLIDCSRIVNLPKRAGRRKSASSSTLKISSSS